LTFANVRGLRVGPQLGEEPLKVFGEFEEEFTVGELGVDGVDLVA